MSNHKAHFRGDLQVDGSIVGPDGQPVGGSVDVSGLLPVDGSRAMTAPIHFAGGDNGDEFGPNLGWDEDNFGLLLSPQPGHSRNDNFADIYLVAEGDTARSGIDISVAEAYSPYLQLDYTPASGFGYSGILNAVGMSVDRSEVVSGYVDASVWLSPGSLGETMFQLSQPGDRDFITLKQLIDNNYRFEIDADAAIHWGGGSAAPDVTLERSGAGWMVLESEGTSLELDVSGNASIFVLDNEDDWIDYAEYGYKGWQVNYDTGMSHLKVNAGQPQFWMSDAHGGVSWTTQQQYFSYAADDPTNQFLAFQIYTDNHPRFKLDQNGRHLWGPGGSNGEDTHLKRRAAGVLELEESGGGLVLHSPDGTAYKISVANGGALSAVAV